MLSQVQVHVIIWHTFQLYVILIYAGTSFLILTGFIKVPDSLKDLLITFISSFSQRTALFTHCRRELMHQVWRVLLDDEFLEAYRHGIVLKCADGILRRVYPRILTYSADYPEKYVAQGTPALPQVNTNVLRL